MVSGPVSPIHVFNPFTGVLFASKTKFYFAFFQGRAVFYFAFRDGHRFLLVKESTPGACVFFS
jgi:hypothetical protein